MHSFFHVKNIYQVSRFIVFTCQKYIPSKPFYSFLNIKNIFKLSHSIVFTFQTPLLGLVGMIHACSYSLICIGLCIEHKIIYSPLPLIWGVLKKLSAKRKKKLFS